MTGASLPGGWLRPVGATGLTATAVCIGGAPLGSMPQAFGYEVGEEDAVSFVEQVLASPIRFIDTSNGYSEGRSEERIGEGIRRFGGLLADFLVATKVDAKDGDYSGARVRRSVEESAARLGIGRLPLVYLHDPEFHEFAALTEPGGAVDTLVELRREGIVGHVGVAGGDTRVLSRYLDLGVFEALLSHNRWTLVDRSAQALIERAVASGVAVMNAAVYGGGILAAPRRGLTDYGYRPASPATLAAVAAMAEACGRYGTDLATAAIAFSLRDPAITSTVVGVSKGARLGGLLAAVDTELPAGLWEELEALTPAPENWLDAP